MLQGSVWLRNLLAAAMMLAGSVAPKKESAMPVISPVMERV
jgi:hypothetical protein